MKVLITGGGGYLGSVLTEKLLYEGFEVVVLDNLKYGQTPLLNCFKFKEFTFINGDVRNNDLLKAQCQDADFIIPLAALTGFAICEKNINEAWDVNHNQIVKLIKFAPKKTKIIFPNTNSGYGTTDGSIFCNEETPLNPISTYGKTKVEAEKYLLENWDGIVLRLATVFGMSPRMRIDLLVNDFVYKAMVDGCVIVYERNFKRNFIHIEDVVDVFLFMIKNYNKYSNNVFNVGLSSANLNKEELLLTIKNQINDLIIVYNEFASDLDKRNYIVSNKKIEKTGWKSSWSLDDGIKQLINGYKILIPKIENKYRNI